MSRGCCCNKLVHQGQPACTRFMWRQREDMSKQQFSWFSIAYFERFVAGAKLTGLNSWIATHFLRTEIATLRIAQYNSTFGEPTFETLYISKALHTATTSTWTQFSWLLQKSSALVKSLWDSLRTCYGCSDVPFPDVKYHVPLFQNETMCKTVQTKMILIGMKMNL